jgi:ubiquinone/menaquinone biosynthesis C-methylase UbiE
VVQNILGARILDVGCGYGKWGFLAKRYCTDRQVTVCGLDLFEPHLHSLAGHGIYDSLRVGNARELPFDDKTFDTAIAIEVLEHLPKTDGALVVAELKRVARMRVIVSTPNYPCYRGGAMTVDGFNPHEAHMSWYTVRELRRLGFDRVLGVGRLKLRPWRVAVALGSLGLVLPSLSRYILGFWSSDPSLSVVVGE